MKTSILISAAIGALIGAGSACAVAFKQRRDQRKKDDAARSLSEQAYQTMLNDFPHFLSQFETFSEEEIYHHQDNIMKIYTFYSDSLLSPLYHMVCFNNLERYKKFTEDEVREYLSTLQNILDFDEKAYELSPSGLEDFKKRHPEKFAEHLTPVD